MNYLRIAAAAATAWASTLAVPGTAQAALGNLSYQESELGKPISLFGSDVFGGSPGGSNTVLMLRDVMIVMGSHDSGKGNGPLHVFDVANPRSPTLLKRFTSAETSDLRELHAMPAAIIDGKDVLVFPSTSGIRFFDFTDPLNPTAVGELALDGVTGGDYDNTVWMLSWAWPYVYVGGTGNGIYIVDATDPSKPSLVTRVETGELGGFRIGAVYAAGNYIVASGMDAKPTRVSVLDVSDPKAPFLLATGAAPASMYSSVVIGDRIYGSGEGGLYSFMKWSPEAVETIAEKQFGTDKGGYCTYQDNFIFCGQSKEGYRKIDISNELDIKQVALADVVSNDADTDFATVLGNLVYLGNDHGSGAGLIPHAMAPDTAPPKLLKTYPGDGEPNQALTTRITLFFSDEIAIDSVGPESLIVRKPGGAAVEGVFSHSSFNAISFGARAPLVADSTYEVVVVKGGLRDLAGNVIAEESVMRFSTGDTVDPAPAGGGSGGSAGSDMAGSAGSGSPAGGGAGGGAGVIPAGPAGAGGAASGGGATPLGASPTDPAGCGCAVPSRSQGQHAYWALALGLWWARRGLRRPSPAANS